MAVNQKPVFATEHITGSGNRLPYEPGQRIDERMPDYQVKAAMEAGLATDDANAARRAADGNAERQADVERQIAERSEKRGQSRRD